MTTRAFWLGFAIVALLWLGAVVTLLVSVASAPNQHFISEGTRHYLLGHAGTEAVGSANFPVWDQVFGGVVVGFDKDKGVLASSSAVFTVDTHTLSSLVANAGNQKSSIKILQWTEPNPRDFYPGGTVDVYIDGTPRLHATLPTKLTNKAVMPPTFYSVAPGTLDFEPLQLTPYYEPVAATLPLTAEDLSGDRIVVRIETHGRALWYIDRVYVDTVFTPSNSPLFSNRAITAVLAALVLALLAAGIGLALRGALVYGGALGLIAALATLLLSLISRDPWDLPIWAQLSDIVAFGGGSPARFWAGTPLWSFAPGILAPIAALWNDAFGRVPAVVTEVALKAALWCAYASVAVQLARFAPQTWKRLVLMLWLVSPFGLFLLSWGVRDLVSSAIFLAAAGLCLRRQFLIAAVLMAAVASIDEYFAALAVLPALACLLSSRRTSALLWKAMLLAALPYGIIALQWLLLPKTETAAVLGFRLAEHFSEATWQGLLEQIGLLPPLLTDPSIHTKLFAGLYVLLALPFVPQLLRLVRGQTERTAEDAFGAALVPLVGCTVAFFLSYGQVDPQEWFGLMVALTLVAFRRKDLMPLVGTFLLVAGIHLYAHVGFRQFLTPAIFHTLETGMWGIRALADVITRGTCIALIAAGAAALSVRRAIPIWGPASAYALLAWFVAMLSIASEVFVNDLVLLAMAFVVCIGLIAAFAPRAQLKLDRSAAGTGLLFAGFALTICNASYWWLLAVCLVIPLAVIAVPSLRKALYDVGAVGMIAYVAALAAQMTTVPRVSLSAVDSLHAIGWVGGGALLLLLGATVPLFGQQWLHRLGLLPDFVEEGRVPDPAPEPAPAAVA